jgi:uncharacterized membrane protein YgaE (UPF0421/DUF939 family)
MAPYKSHSSTYIYSQLSPSNQNIRLFSALLLSALKNQKNNLYLDFEELLSWQSHSSSYVEQRYCGSQLVISEVHDVGTL